MLPMYYAFLLEHSEVLPNRHRLGSSDGGNGPLDDLYTHGSILERTRGSRWMEAYLIYSR
jgi:hypothetical protein